MTEQIQNKPKRNVSKVIKKSLWMFLITLKWIFIVIIIGGFLAGGAVTGYVAYLVKDDEVRSSEFIYEKINENALTGFIYFNDGETLVGQMRTEEDRRPVKLTEIPELLQEAFLATEDKNFENHYGVDLNGLFRAVRQKVSNADTQTGGSTITQQLARNVFLSLDRTDDRKVKEIFLALRLERHLTKNEILEAYLNRIPFGNGSTGYSLFGVKAAAKGIFDIDDLNKLNVAQIAYIAGLPQLPSKYSAFDGYGKFNETRFNNAVERQKLVLKRMHIEEKITTKQYEDALAFDLRSSLAMEKPRAYNTYPYLMLEAEKKAAEILLELENEQFTAKDRKSAEYAKLLPEYHEKLLRGGYQVTISIDQDIYHMMQDVGQDPDNFSPDHEEKGIEQVGAIMIQNNTGAILGMTEGRGFHIEQLNHATQMIRQPGSTMKPIAAYLPALNEGLIQPAGIIDDIPVLLKDGGSGVHIPKNWNNEFHGLVTAREALDRSYNIPAIRLFLEYVTMEKSWEYVRNMGITTITEKDEKQASTGVIGGLERGTTVEELTNAYSVIPNKGVFLDAYMIEKIVGPNNQIVYQHQKTPKTITSPQAAYLMTDMLTTVISNPRATAQDLRSQFKYYNQIDIAGKTGSTQDDHDAWFIGFTPDVTVGVWAGYDQPATLSTREARNRAKSIWALIMNNVIDESPELFPNHKFEQPEGIVQVTVSNVSGKLPSKLVLETNRVVRDLFDQKYVPKEEDDVLYNEAIVTYKGKTYLPNPKTPEDMVTKKLLVKREKPISELLKEIEAATSKISKDRRLPIESYRPKDGFSDMPTEMDPREDDGQAPAPPTNLSLKVQGEQLEVTFVPSASEDVVGYRIYRSIDGQPFNLINKVVLYDDPSVFQEIIQGQRLYGFYITAVDVVGNESSPSDVIFSDGQSGKLPADDDPDGEATDDDDDDEKGNGNGNSNGASGDSGDEQSNAIVTPTNVKVKSRGQGVRIQWNHPSPKSVLSYQVYFSEDPSGHFNRIGTTESTSFDYISDPIEGWYVVVAVYAAGESSPTAPVQYSKEED